MARDRMLRVEFWSDEKVAKLSYAGRLLFQGLWSFADDAGNCRANPTLLRSMIFPFDDVKITDLESWIDLMVNIGLITRYSSSGENYLCIKNFNRHQRIDRPSKRRNPLPVFDECSTSARRVLADEVKLNEIKLNKVPDKNPVSPNRLFGLYNQLCHQNQGMPKAEKLSKGRQAICRARIEEYPDESFWLAYFERAGRSEFLHGRAESARAGWRGDFDFLINPNNLVKVLEGKYDNREKKIKTIEEKYGKPGAIKI